MRATDALGQVLGSGTTAVMDKGMSASLSDIKVDPLTTIAAGVGTAGGSIVAKGVANTTAKPVVGQMLNKTGAGAPRAGGLAAGAVAEGAIVGAAEKSAPEIKEILTVYIFK